MTLLDSDASSGLGGTIGSRVAGHLSRAIAETRVRLGPHQAAVAQTILAEFTNHVSDEIRSVMGPLWLEIANDPDVPSHWRNLATKLGTERGQAWTWIAGQSTSLAMGGGLGLLLTNELQPVIGRLVRGNPHIPLAAADAASALAHGLITRSFMEGDAGQWGLDETRRNILTELNRISLSGGEILELFGKGWIDRAQALRHFTRAGWDGHHGAQLLSLGRTWISPRDGGSMWNRSIIDMEQLEEIVIRNGHHVSDAQKYADVTGEPLPIQDLFVALRRGIIDEARARRGWVQGPVRNEWFDVAIDLQFAPMTTVDAADSVNQGHMPLEEAREIAKWNGLMPEHFDVLTRNAGLPPGVELATEAWNRGLITEAEFTTAFLESRLKNIYVPLYKKLRYRVIPQETVRRLYREGTYTREQAKTRLQWAGFAPEDAEALLAAEDSGGQEATRELTKAEIVSLYADRAITSDEATTMLGSLGYSAEEVGWLIGLADIRKARKFADAVIARLRAGYVAYRMTEAEVSSFMDNLRIPPDQRDELVGLWDLERLALTRGLTPAQVKSAMKKGFITQEAAVERLAQQGYSEDDAIILLSI